MLMPEANLTQLSNLFWEWDQDKMLHPVNYKKWGDLCCGTGVWSLWRDRDERKSSNIQYFCSLTTQKSGGVLFQ